MAGVLFAHGHNGQTIAAAFGRQIKVYDFRQLPLEQRHENFIERHTQHGWLVWRLASVGAVVQRITPQGDAIYREDGEPVLLVVIPGMVAIRPLQCHLVAGIGSWRLPTDGGWRDGV